MATQLKSAISMPLCRRSEISTGRRRAPLLVAHELIRACAANEHSDCCRRCIGLNGCKFLCGKTCCSDAQSNWYGACIIEYRSECMEAARDPSRQNTRDARIRG
jgi:hypothetical protein